MKQIMQTAIKKATTKPTLIGALSLLACSLLAGCATAVPNNTVLVPGRQVVQPPALVQVPNPSRNFRLVVGNNPALVRAFQQYAKTGRAPNILTDGFIQFAYNAAQQPIIQTTPFQETVISLEPGEHFTNISSGDPDRWSYSVAVSGTGLNQQQNILVKPALPNISTNLVITTDRRLYTVRLVSTRNANITRTVSFWYPDEMLQAVNAATQGQWNTTIANVPNINLGQLNFNYRIDSGWFCRPPVWTPLRVFDDGTHTYIQFPAGLASTDMPALFVLDNHNDTLVNYRYKAPYVIVDKIFQQAVLITGVGHAQTRVTLTNRRFQ